MSWKERLKIICIDDEPEILDIISDQIKALGYTPKTFSKSSDAVVALKGDLNDVILIISDFNIPEMSGLEIRRECFAQTKNIPFIVISGYVSREEALKAIDLKIAGFIEKPANEEKLKSIIEKETEELVKVLKDEFEMTDAFLGDAETLVEQMEVQLLSLEKDPGNIEIVNHIFALAHTIKGGSGFIKPDFLHRFTHKFEDFLSTFKKSGQPVPPGAVSILLSGLDTIKILIEALKKADTNVPAVADLCKIFENFNASDKSGTNVSSVSNGTGAPSSPLNSDGKAQSKVASNAPQAVDEIRVSMKLLDEFMELSGEITVIRNMINKLVRAIEKDLNGNKDVALLAELLDEMHKINSQMQEKIVDLRKVPMRTVFRPLPRTLRDISKILKKDIALVTVGDEVRVDNTIAEVLSNSLTHMLRNGADHAIESIEDRKKKGKPEQGTIKISGVDHGEHIVVTIEDDGKGIDANIIREKAIEKKVITREESAMMTDSQIQSLIFESGFSTAAVVTDVSGRGVGMDMVKKAVTKIGGRIDVNSVVGKGSRFDLHLPIPKSVNIIAALLVRSGKDVFCLPQDNIFRLLTLGEEDFKNSIKPIEGAHILQLDKTIYPLINLSETLKGNSCTENAKRVPAGSQTADIVLLKSNNCFYGLVVDEILDMEDIVVKDLAKNFRDLKIFAGATFLGDGRVGLILNSDGLGAINGISAHITNSTASEVDGDKVVQAHDGWRDLVLFNLAAPGQYGIYLDEIMRLESFAESNIQLSGEQPVVIYRDVAVPLICAGQQLGVSATPVFETQTEYPTLIVKTGKSCVGLVVNQIVDLQSCPPADTVAKDRDGIWGAAILGDKTITIIDAKELLKNSHFNIHLQANIETQSKNETIGEMTGVQAAA